MGTVIVEIRELKEKFEANPSRFELKPGDSVLLATSTGLETGKVLIIKDSESKKEAEMKVIRHLNENDFKVMIDNRKKACEITPRIKEEVIRQKLEMKLTHVSFTYDRQKLYVYYTAEDRVDFRELIRVLGSKLKTRIQMVQIGVRDQLSIVGGVGICGRDVCCHSFLGSIKTVNTYMARNQRISINQENITGCCGRLLCCLSYENEYYKKNSEKYPKIGRKIQISAEKAVVIDVNILKETVTIKFKDGAVKEMTIEEINKLRGEKGTAAKL